MLLWSLYIAIATVSLIEYNPLYKWIIFKIRLNIKPLNCAFCLSTYIGAIIGFYLFSYAGISLALTTPIIAMTISKLISNLPFTIK